MFYQRNPRRCSWQPLSARFGIGRGKNEKAKKGESEDGGEENWIIRARRRWCASRFRVKSRFYARLVVAGWRINVCREFLTCHRVLAYFLKQFGEKRGAEHSRDEHPRNPSRRNRVRTIGRFVQSSWPELLGVPRHAMRQMIIIAMRSSGVPL